MGDVPEHVRQAERRGARERGEYVGFVSCSHGVGRVLKVAQPDQRQRLRVPCPVEGCPEGKHETADSMARPRLRGEKCDVELPAAPDPDDPTAPDPDDTTALRGRQQVSDAALLEAIPEQGAPATEIARALGYTKAQGMVRRIRRMNRRAKDRGEREPVQVTGGGSSRAGMMLRRAPATMESQ